MYQRIIENIIKDKIGTSSFIMKFQIFHPYFQD